MQSLEIQCSHALGQVVTNLPGLVVTYLEVTRLVTFLSFSLYNINFGVFEYIFVLLSPYMLSRQKSFTLFKFVFNFVSIIKRIRCLTQPTYMKNSEATIYSELAISIWSETIWKLPYWCILVSKLWIGVTKNYSCCIKCTICTGVIAFLQLESYLSGALPGFRDGSVTNGVSNRK